MDSRKRKGIIGGITVFLAATMLIGGTLAWTDFTQSRTNRFRGSVYYDATLHDDFDGENKDVYVENSGENTIYVRVRLDEYMQIGNVNMKGQNVTEKGSITSLDKDQWITHLYLQEADGDPANCTAYVPTADETAGDSIQFHKFYKWNMSGEQIWYTPGTPGVVASELDGIKTDEDGTPVKDMYGAEIPIVNPEKTSDTQKQTLGKAAPITMARYVELAPIGAKVDANPAYDPNDLEDLIWDEFLWDAVKSGCWILDVDGWAYWSQPLEPGTATNLLLDDVTLVGKMPTDNWYYAIDVKLQAVSLNETTTTWQTSGTYTAEAEKLIESWHGDV